MIYQVFSVFDKQVSAYLPPFMCRTQGEAIRSFTEAVNDASKPFGKYATDYSLMCHGEFDDTSGAFLCHDPVRVISASELIVDSVEMPASSMSMGNGQRMPI